MSICTNCNGKGYNTVYKGEGGYTDFGSMKYIETTPMGIQKVPCSKCQAKEDKELEKETTGQKVYEQLQDIQEAILKKIDCQEYRLYHDFIAKGNKSIVADNRYNIALNKPISLSRVLSALGEKYIYKQGSLVAMIIYEKPIEGEKCYFVEIPRKLLTDTGSDAYLDDQSDETIEALHKLLVRK